MTCRIRLPRAPWTATQRGLPTVLLAILLWGVSGPSAMACTLYGDTCATNTDCCSGLCKTSTSTCTVPTRNLFLGPVYVGRDILATPDTPFEGWAHFETRFTDAISAPVWVFDARGSKLNSSAAANDLFLIRSEHNSGLPRPVWSIGGYGNGTGGPNMMKLYTVGTPSNDGDFYFGISFSGLASQIMYLPPTGPTVGQVLGINTLLGGGGYTTQWASLGAFGGVTGTGTAGHLAKWTTTTAIGSASPTEGATDVSFGIDNAIIETGLALRLYEATNTNYVDLRSDAANVLKVGHGVDFAVKFDGNGTADPRLTAASTTGTLALDADGDVTADFTFESPSASPHDYSKLTMRQPGTFMMSDIAAADFAPTTGWRFDTTATMEDIDYLFEVINNGTTKFRVYGDGRLSTGQIGPPIAAATLALSNYNSLGTLQDIISIPNNVDQPDVAMTGNLDIDGDILPVGPHQLGDSLAVWNQIWGNIFAANSTMAFALGGNISASIDSTSFTSVVDFTIDGTSNFLMGTGSFTMGGGAITGAGAVDATSFTGPLTGNASTATALAANPTNCPAGEAPLGVDAGGNVEGCFVGPTGATGSTGATGPTGATGATGPGVAGTSGTIAKFTSATAIGDSALVQAAAGSIVQTVAMTTGNSYNITGTFDQTTPGTAQAFFWNPTINNSASASAHIYGFAMAPALAASSTFGDAYLFDAVSPTGATLTGTNSASFRSRSNIKGTVTNVWGFQDVPGNNLATITRTQNGSFISKSAASWAGGTRSITDWYGLKVEPQTMTGITGAGGAGTPNKHSVSLAYDGDILDNMYLYWAPNQTTALASRSGGIRYNTTTPSVDIEIGTTVRGSVTATGVFSNGQGVASGTGSNSHGVTLWGETTAVDANFDTGTEVCAGNSPPLTCVTTADVLGTPIACGTAHIVISQWLAFCK